jgi:hypothetical protein
LSKGGKRRCKNSSELYDKIAQIIYLKELCCQKSKIYDKFLFF